MLFLCLAAETQVLELVDGFVGMVVGVIVSNVWQSIVLHNVKVQKVFFLKKNIFCCFLSFCTAKEREGKGV